MAPLILNILKVTPADVPRFRDAYFHNGMLVLYTRTGGGNREAYAEQNQKLRELPGYVSDDDDTFDSTFANFRYNPPPCLLADLELIAKKLNTKTPAERIQDVINSLKP